VLISIEAAMKVLGLGSRGEIYRKINGGHLPSFPGPRGKLVERDGLEELWAKINRPKSKHPPRTNSQPSQPSSPAPRQPAKPAPRPGPAPRLDGPEDLAQDPPPDYHVSHARAEYEKANLLELQRKTQEGQLLRREDAEQAWGSAVNITRSRLLGVPSAAKQRIPHLELEEVELLTLLIREALEELAAGDLTA
jgi:hypothetical protein